MDAAAVTLALAALAVAGLLTAWTFRRSRRMLDEWAAENGFGILSAQVRWFRRGPFTFRSSDNQIVYYVEVVDADGRARRGWVRCGGFWWGVLARKADVRWDERDALGERAAS